MGSAYSTSAWRSFHFSSSFFSAFLSIFLYLQLNIHAHIIDACATLLASNWSFIFHAYAFALVSIFNTLIQYLFSYYCILFSYFYFCFALLWSHIPFYCCGACSLAYWISFEFISLSYIMLLVLPLINWLTL